MQPLLITMGTHLISPRQEEKTVEIKGMMTIENETNDMTMIVTGKKIEGITGMMTEVIHVEAHHGRKNNGNLAEKTGEETNGVSIPGVKEDKDLTEAHHHLHHLQLDGNMPQEQQPL